jgi:cytochrome P450
MAHAPEMTEELLGYARYRREHLGDDVTSLLLTLERTSGPLSDEQIGSVMWNLVAGGVDTTTSLASWALHHLGTHPEARRRLVDEPELMPLAIEEYLRYYCPNESLTRTAARDVELGGRQIRKGDRLWVSWISANRDPKAFDRADEVVIDRDPNHHLAFGLGGHRCIGMHVARAETEVMLTEVLRRIPDFAIDPDAFAPYPGSMMMNGIVNMPATFSPGPRVGPAERPF